MIVPELLPRIAPRIFSPEIAAIVQSNSLYLIPVLIVLSLAGCLLGTYFTPPEDPSVLKHFYKTTRPWGWWGPIRDQVVAEDPSFRPNDSAVRDCINVAVGIVWQLCLTSLPIFIVLQSWERAVAVFLVLVVTSIIIKLNWYDKLPREKPIAAR
jgi:solute:Na+ symporter, SSS family